MAGEETSIKGLFQGLAGDGMQVIQGVVKSTSPLKIQAVNDDKLTVGPGNVIVPRHLTDYDTEVTVHWQTEAAAATPHSPPTRTLSRGERRYGYTMG